MSILVRGNQFSPPLPLTRRRHCTAAFSPAPALHHHHHLLHHLHGTTHEDNKIQILVGPELHAGFFGRTIGWLYILPLLYHSTRSTLGTSSFFLAGNNPMPSSLRPLYRLASPAFRSTRHSILSRSLPHSPALVIPARFASNMSIATLDVITPPSRRPSQNHSRSISLI